MTYAYATTNLLSGLAVGSFGWASGLNDATRSRLNDVRMSSRYVNGSPVTTVTLIIDLGSAVASTGVAILNSNVATSALAPTLRIRGATNSIFTTGVVTAKAASTLNTSAPYNKDHVLQYASITKQYLELLWTFTGTATNFAVGELWAFNAQTQLTRKSIYGGGEDEEIYSSSVDFYNGGNRSYFLGGPVRTQRLPFSDLSLTERLELATMWRATRGPVSPFLWIDSYEATDTAAAATEQSVIYGKLAVPAFTWKEQDYQLFDPGELIIRSLGREVGS